MTTIDMHAHTGDFTGFIPGGMHDAAELVARWDESGVEQGLISVLDSHDVPGSNDRTRLACERYPDRIKGYVYLYPPDVEGSLAELERCRSFDCFRGVKLHPSGDVYYPFHDGYYPVYEAIERAGLPVLWHSGTSPYSHPLQIAVVARDFPGTPHVLAHFALADLTWECFPAAKLAANVMVDTSANPIIPVINEWIERFGAERMLWGSDFPFYDVAYEHQKLAYLAASDADRQRIASGNARRVFGL
jgi:predicted TIM-barrel fold metal-dependent hydrolase